MDALSMNIKAIETEYRGYKFRSRLEARWAVFFDALGLNWLYESEGFVLNDGSYYLPDFKVTSKHGLVSWYEIKPASDISSEKMAAFRATVLAEMPMSTINFQTLRGDPVDVLDLMDICPRCGAIAPSLIYSNAMDVEMYFSCFPCDFNTECGGGHPIEAGEISEVYPHKGSVCVPNPAAYNQKILIAANKARSARFEHGERG